MNILRILPYAHEQKVVDYLKDVLEELLAGTKETPMAVSEADKPASTKMSLIVPAAADKPEYENGIPYIFGQDQDGVAICVKSVMGLDLKQFDKVYFTILKKHNERFFIEDLMNLQFKRLGITNAKVVVLDNSTADQAETVYQTIEQERIAGTIFIKDADCYFKTDMSSGNGVAIYPIESLDVLAPKDKSYVAVDDMYYITNIIEKSVVGHYISAGGYLVNTKDFLHYYKELRNFGKLYLSHIIYAMLLDKKTFRPMMVEEYKDWGTKKAWKYNE